MVWLMVVGTLVTGTLVLAVGVVTLAWGVVVDVAGTEIVGVTWGATVVGWVGVGG